MSQKHSVASSDESWAQLRANVKNCRFINCPRNQEEKLPILFDRKKDSLTRIRFLVLSQEPAASLRKILSNPAMIEEFLINECACNSTPKKGGLPAKIREVFNKRFDPATSEIYWTHSLKCVPRSDQDINREWEKCAHVCKDHFNEEVALIPSKRLTIIPLGNYALALCRHLFEGEPLSSTRGIMRYISTMIAEKEVSFREKKIFLFPFIHPAHHEKVLRRHDRKGIVRDREKEFIERIRQMDKS